MLNNRCFGTFRHPLITATQISLAMDYKNREVLMPEMREKISDRKSTKELGGEITPELKNLLMATMVSPENAAWMCRQSIEVESSKIRLSKVAASNAASTASPVSRDEEYTILLL